MKVLSIKIFRAFTIITLTLSLFGCGLINNNGSSIQPQNSLQSSDISQSEDAVSISPPISDQSSKEEPEKKAYIFHAALEGAVIISSNSETGEVEFSKKCEKCGKVQPGSTNVCLGGYSTWNSGFTCFNCNNNQKVAIKTTIEYR